MPDEQDPAFDFTVTIQRGNGTNDRDKLRAKVSAETIAELGEKVEHVREKMEEWAVGFRDIQPGDVRRLADDQSQLGDVKP